ncbi:MAG: SAF domain-containing protein [Intrasporangium sp.]|uniref:SAF domain-containing protein n=1 Tax=Intrasporangium sp. TaxID=1925024 RepID=UPI002649D0B9|nr:SAF domain-containing protein [Intrasporangium sp.]MDN5795342.1 SAF domain-containing protein [Intrasporangium sp.]
MRRWGAALLAALAGFVGVTALTPRGAAAPGVATVVAAHDLPAGITLTADDLVIEPRPSSQRPETAATRAGDVVGKVLATPVSAREVVTASRLRGPGILSGQAAGTVAMSVPVLDPQAAGVTSGNRVDLYASGSGDRVASDVAVLAVHVPETSTISSGGAASITLALDEPTASRVAQAVSTLQAGEIFVVALRAG